MRRERRGHAAEAHGVEMAVEEEGAAATRARQAAHHTGAPGHRLQTRDLQARGCAVLLPGHYATERFGMEELAQELQAEFKGLKVWASERERDPLQVVK